MNLILLGAPGAGKGTQAEVISKKHNLFHVSTGNLFRKALEEGKELGQLAKSFMDRGELVPDEVVARIVIQNVPETQGCLFDGFPRNLAQAEILDEILKRREKTIDVVCNIQVDHQSLLQRMLSRGRSDDNMETIQNRLKVYEDQTKPLIDYYKKQSKLASVNGNVSVPEVTKQIETLLSKGGHIS